MSNEYPKSLPNLFLNIFSTIVFTFIRGRELNPNIFFSNFSGASGISRRNPPGISRQKSLIPWVSRDIPNFLAPTLSRGRPPPHQKISGPKSLGLGSFFCCLKSARWPHMNRPFWMRPFLLTVGSFLLTVELFGLQWCLGAFLLTCGAFLVTIGAFLRGCGRRCLLEPP